MLPSAVFGKLVEIRNGEVTVIVSQRCRYFARIPEGLAPTGLRPACGSGLAAGAGVSPDTTEIARLPESLEEARLALEFASGTRPLMHFSDVDLPEFLIRRADKTALRLIPEWMRHLTPANGGPAANCRAPSARSPNAASM